MGRAIAKPIYSNQIVTIQRNFLFKINELIVLLLSLNIKLSIYSVSYNLRHS